MTAKSSKIDKRQKKWIDKCVSNFSLYANVIGNNCDDPYEEAAAIEAGEYKVKISKSTKKRLRKQMKKKRLGPSQPAQIRKLNLALAKKQTAKAIKKMANQLQKLPL